MPFDYLHNNYCITCHLKLPKTVYRCPQCRRKVRVMPRRQRNKNRIRELKASETREEQKEQLLEQVVSGAIVDKAQLIEKFSKVL